MQKPDKKAVKKPKVPKKISAQYLENAALYYLERYAASTTHFRRVMQRKIDKSCRHHGDDPQSFAPLLDALVQRYVGAGLLDDATYTRAKTTSMRRKGLSRRMIFMKMEAKGINAATTAPVLDALDAENATEDADAEFQAAMVQARRKKLGPFRTRPPATPADIRKEMAALARAGFAYDICRRVIHDDTDDTADGEDGDF